jgi:hypothetical protein
MQHRAAQFVEI